MMKTWLLLFSFAAQTAQAGPCHTPRSAAATLFDGTNHGDLALAKACMQLPPGTQGERVAVQLKQVLDARGLWVPVATLPVDPDYKNDEGVHQVFPMKDEFPSLVLIRDTDGNWKYSEQTLAAVPRQYAETFSTLSTWFQSNLPAVFYKRILSIYGWQFLYGALLALGAWLSGRFVQMLIRTRANSAAKRLGVTLDDRGFERAANPVGWAVTFSILWYLLPDVQLPLAVSHPALWGLRVSTWIAGVMAAYRFVDVGESIARTWAAGTDTKLDDQAIPLLRQTVRALLVVFGGLYIADAMGFDVWKLAAGVGIGGLAFALAAQDTVANVFGSVNIFLDRPFQIGDWVQVDGTEGVVEEVGFRSTRVRTFYNSLVTVPNSRITNAKVDNLGVRPRRRIKLTLGLTYNTPPDMVQAYVEGVRAILATHPLVQRTYEVHFYNMNDFALEILVYYHVITPGWHEELVTRSQNLLEFMRLADELGVSFAFPSTSVYVESTPERPLQPADPGSITELQQLVDSFAPGGSRARPSGPPFSKSWTVQDRDERQDRGSA